MLVKALVVNLNEIGIVVTSDDSDELLLSENLKTPMGSNLGKCTFFCLFGAAPMAYGGPRLGVQLEL